jgi:hypothetical protein
MKGGTKMGYYKNLEIELQHDPELQEIVAWDIAHRDQLTAEERWAILTNDNLLQVALAKWRNADLPAPKPASDHVALHVSRRDLRKRSRMNVAGWVLVWSSILVCVLLMLVLA